MNKPISTLIVKSFVPGVITVEECSYISIVWCEAHWAPGDNGKWNEWVEGKWVGREKHWAVFATGKLNKSKEDIPNACIIVPTYNDYRITQREITACFSTVVTIAVQEVVISIPNFQAKYYG